MKCFFLKLILFLLITLTSCSQHSSDNVKISRIRVYQDKNFSGRGNSNEEILKLQVYVNGSSYASIENLVFKMTGTSDISKIENVKLYTTGDKNVFDSRNPTQTGATILGIVKPTEGEIKLQANGNIKAGVNYLWLTYDIKKTAKEGNKIDAEVISLTTENETYIFEDGNPDGAREILLGRKLIFAPGDYGSTNYRIPAICTADDGTLITLTDKRKFNYIDLPEDIDVVCRRSTDNGKTWEEPITVIRGQGFDKGYGDPVLIKAKSGKIVALFVGGPGLWRSTSENPLRAYVSTSADNGLTWTEAKEITHFIYGKDCKNEERAYWQAMFFGSGQGLCTRIGRIMAVGVFRIPNEKGLQNYIIYSDDEGETWKVSNRAITTGDEAKVVELNSGEILISSRTPDPGHRLWAKSLDGGVNWGEQSSWEEIWGNNCDADIVRYTSTKDGYDKNRILHTLPNGKNRVNVTMWISYDETETWPIKKTICSGQSAYSSICILKDGTIGVYLEEDGLNPYRMYFLNFSLDWLTNGKDTFKSAK